jgi:hypothetical protein
MEAILQDCYVVFARELITPGRVAYARERELVTCSSYEEARWVQRECTSPTRQCIIRYVGPAGGGD